MLGSAKSNDMTEGERMLKPVRVLAVGMTATAGGIESFLMNLCGRMDPQRVQVDFLTRFDDAVYPQRRAAIGKTYVIPRRSQSPVRFYREIRSFFEAHAAEYDVLWDNECMFNDMTPLKLAAKHGIPVRIAHSHNPRNMDVSWRGRAQEALHRLQRRRLSRYANALWACSEASARWACPAMDIPHAVVPNAIDAQVFRPDEEVRRAMRAEWGMEGCLIVGHAGRLQYQKNQSFLLEAFACLRKAEPRARLVLCGGGPDREKLMAQAAGLGIAEDVLFLGERQDVPRVLQAFDVFAMPSRFEGLGIAALEAQAAGLPCLLSDAVPKEAAAAKEVYYLPAEDPRRWARQLREMLRKAEGRDRPDNAACLAQAGYDLDAAAEQLMQRLEQLVRRGDRYRRRFVLTVLSSADGVPAMNKARRDAQQIAERSGYIPLRVRAKATADDGLAAKVRLALQAGGDWLKLCLRLRRGDLLLMQYPYFPVKAAPLARMGLRLLRRKGVCTAALVHDLDSLRGVSGSAALWSDRKLLPAFDRIICHNARMRQYLAAQGIPDEKLTELGIFDYLTGADVPLRSLSMEICVAGNLRCDKAGYLYALPRSGIQWRLYGDGWTGEAREDVLWCGSESPEELPGFLQGSFGLVWDGDSTDTCTGTYGRYLALNNPHKLSLYLAAGLPALVWSGSALAGLVCTSGAGLAVGSIAEAEAAIGNLTPEAYARMAARAAEIGGGLRRGMYLTDALHRMEK